MPLSFQLVPVPVGGGIDEKQDPSLLPMGELATLQNGYHTKVGSVQKRNGFSQLGASGSLWYGQLETCPPFQQLSTYDDQLVGINQGGTSAYSYSPQAQLWTSTNRLPPCIATRSSIQNNGTTIINADVCYCNGCFVYAWGQLDPTVADPTVRLYYTVTDAVTGAVLVSQQSYDINSSAGNTSCCIKLVTNAGGANTPYVVVLWTSSPGGSSYVINAIKLDMSHTPPLVVAGPQELAVGPSPSYVMDACAGYTSASTDLFFVGYGATNSTVQLNSYSFTSLNQAASASFTSVPMAPGVVADAVGVGCMSGTVGLVYSTFFGFVGPTVVVPNWFSASNLHPLFTGSFGNLLSTTDQGDVQVAVAMAPGSFGSALFNFVWETSAAANSQERGFPFPSVTAQPVLPASGSMTVLGAPVTTFNLRMLSRPFFVQNTDDLQRSASLSGIERMPRCCFLGWLSSSLQGTQFVIDCSTSMFPGADPVSPQMAPIATIAPLLSQYAGINGPSQLASVVVPGPAGYPYGSSYPLVFNTLGSIALDIGSQQRAGVELLALDFSPLKAFETQEISDDLCLSAGVPSYYDGSATGEIGFLMFPDPVSYSILEFGDLQGTYQYAVCYEWIDNAGNKHQSAPSIQTAVNPDEQGVMITVPPCTLTNRQQVASGSTHPINTAIYRSQANGTVLFRLTPDAATNTLANVMYDYAIFVDLGEGMQSDAAIGSNSTLYTEGGVLPNFPPPSSRYCVLADQRLWLAGCDNPKQVFYSQQQANGLAPTFCGDTLSFFVDDGGPITGLAAMDDSLIIFKDDKIFQLDVVGQGPTAGGTQNQLQAPTRVPTDGVGCINHRSICLTPDGVIFQSSVGIYLLSRNLEVQNIGNPVTDSLAANSTITSAVIHPTKSQVRFTCGNLQLAPGVPSHGVTLVNDYINSSWSVDIVYDPVQQATSSMAYAATVFNGAYVRASAVTSGSFPCSAATFTETTGYVDGPLLSSATFIPTTVTSPWISVADLQGHQLVSHVAALVSVFDRADITLSVATDYNEAFTQVGTWPAAQVGQSLVNSLMSSLQLHVRDQRSQAFKVKVSDAFAADGSSVTGQGMGLVRVTLRAGAKPGLARVQPAGRQ
jgi:hypothetical protein